VDKTVIHICKGCDIADSHLGERLFLNELLGGLNQALLTLGPGNGGSPLSDRFFRWWLLCWHA
jgi:hypothetical protein